MQLNFAAQGVEMQYVKRIFLVATAIFLAVSVARAAELKRVEESKANSLFVEYLRSRGLSPDDYAFKLKAFGKATWIISCYATGMKPSLPWRHVMNSRGEVDELTMDSLNGVFLNEYSALPEEKDRTGLIQEFVKLHAGEEVSIVNGAADIPGYAKAPLDQDIAGAVRAPFSFSNLITVVYTYQQIGGIVRRYRFQFQNGVNFSRVEVAVVGRAIGEARYYE